MPPKSAIKNGPSARVRGKVSFRNKTEERWEEGMGKNGSMPVITENNLALSRSMKPKNLDKALTMANALAANVARGNSPRASNARENNASPSANRSRGGRINIMLSPAKAAPPPGLLSRLAARLESRLTKAASPPKESSKGRSVYKNAGTVNRLRMAAAKRMGLTPYRRPAWASRRALYMKIKGDAAAAKAQKEVGEARNQYAARLRELNAEKKKVKENAQLQTVVSAIVSGALHKAKSNAWKGNHEERKAKALRKLKNNLQAKEAALSPEYRKEFRGPAAFLIREALPMLFNKEFLPAGYRSYYENQENRAQKTIQALINLDKSEKRARESALKQVANEIRAGLVMRRQEAALEKTMKEGKRRRQSAQRRVNEKRAVPRSSPRTMGRLAAIARQTAARQAENRRQINKRIAAARAANEERARREALPLAVRRGSLFKLPSSPKSKNSKKN